MFVSVVVILNFDTGVFPSCINLIQNDMNITSYEIAILGNSHLFFILIIQGNLPFFGICSVALVINTIFQKFGVKISLLISLIMNIASCMVVTFTWNKYMMGLGRFFQGVSQTFFVVYGPIWCVNFAPLNNKNLWVGIL